MEATSAVSSARSSRKSFVFRIVVAVLVLLLVMFLAFDFWFYRAVRAALPLVDGTVQLAGLNAPVIVTRDSLGVPTISAENTQDLFYAQGYVTAQDRLWQMDLTRRFASGDLAEVMGTDLVKVDKAQRILGLRQVAEQVVTMMPAEERGRFEAYARGVNAYIAQHSKTLPLEFRFLVYFPHVWTVEDSVLIGLSLSEFLNHGLYKDELEKEKVLAKLGPELTADLFVNSSWRDHPPGAEARSIENDVPGEESPDEEEDSATPKKAPMRKPKRSELRGPGADRVLGGGAEEQQIPRGLDFTALLNADGYPLHRGSNNWVVSGAHTVSGKPLLSNDMHLDLQIPNIWYEAHIIAGDFDVAGVTLPGVPYVIVGHNRHIAWGCTNVGPNVEDVYIEKFNDRGEYLTPQGWKQPEHRKEIIRVKGKPEVNLDVVVTRHGPIITSLVPGETRQLALKWIIYDARTVHMPFFAVDQAGSWEQFRAAFAEYGGPAQNLVYADDEGHIGYQATGFIPIRAAGDGSVPVPGEDDAHEWTGYLEYDKLPRLYDPPSGIIATANGRITPDGYPYMLSIEWGSPYRTQRIYKLLSGPKKLAPADMLAIQTDIVSDFDRYCASRFVYAVDHAPKASQRAKTAADLMRNWNGSMSADSPAPTLEVYSRRKLEEMLLRPKLGDDWKMYRWFMQPVWVENTLLRQPSRWLPEGYATYDELLAAAVEAAVSDPQTPTALGVWNWGKVHRVDIAHPFWSHVPIIKRAAGPGSQPLSGNEETVKQVGTHFGPSERLTVDFSNFDGSTLNIVNGESGNIFDEHYNDQWDAYYHGRTFTFPFSPSAVQQAGVHHLRLEPQP